MKKHSRILAMALAGSMMLSLAACAPKAAAPTAAPTKAPVAADPTVAPAAPVEITWWAFPTFGADSGYEQELADAFMAKNEGITVKVETIDFQAGPDKLTAAITAGTAPDV
ncbi:MAG: extracellular solute-binding protein, partial [Pseudoflavonifractor sp.]